MAPRRSRSRSRGCPSGKSRVKGHYAKNPRSAGRHFVRSHCQKRRSRSRTPRSGKRRYYRGSKAKVQHSPPCSGEYSQRARRYLGVTRSGRRKYVTYCRKPFSPGGRAVGCVDFTIKKLRERISSKGKAKIAAYMDRHHPGKLYSEITRKGPLCVMYLVLVSGKTPQQARGVLPVPAGAPWRAAPARGGFLGGLFGGGRSPAPPPMPAAPPRGTPRRGITQRQIEERRRAMGRF